LNVVERIVAIGAAIVAGSFALLGLDSFVETAFGVIIIWRLPAERREVDNERIVAGSGQTTNSDRRGPRGRGL
jgi:hypothetical protein